MELYDRYVLPRLVDLVCAGKEQRKQRRQIVPLASGRVLELGFGTGLNAPFYVPERVERVWALDPSAGMRALARPRIQAAGVPIELIAAGAEDIPLETGSVDTVVMTYTLCSIADVPRALRETRRVLKPGGRLLFCEHGAAPDAGVLRWQRRLTPAWSRVAGGCHLDRAVPALLESHGFRLLELKAAYLHGWRPASYNYWGTASAGSTGSRS